MSRQNVVWSEQEYLDYCRRMGISTEEAALLNSHPHSLVKAPSRRKKTQAEAEYEVILRLAHPNSKVLYEAYTLKLAPDTRYTPDLALVYTNSVPARIDFYEIKGRYIFAKALNKPKIAAAMFPQHRFFLASKTVNGWNVKQLMPE